MYILNISMGGKMKVTVDDIIKKYKNKKGDEEAETIINWHKQEAKEDGVVFIFASNSVISNAIKRCRPGLRKVQVLPVGANLYFDVKYVRPFHTILKVAK